MSYAILPIGLLFVYIVGVMLTANMLSVDVIADEANHKRTTTMMVILWPIVLVLWLLKQTVVIVIYFFRWLWQLVTKW